MTVKCKFGIEGCNCGIHKKAVCISDMNHTFGSGKK